MININNQILYWIKCSQTTWINWFKARSNGLNEFINVEKVLFDALVVDDLMDHGYILNKKSPFSFIKVMYKENKENHMRTVYYQQKSGNIYGKLQAVNLSLNQFYSIKSIDTTGHMLNGSPYVEILIEKGFILEEIHNLDFILNPDY